MVLKEAKAGCRLQSEGARVRACVLCCVCMSARCSLSDVCGVCVCFVCLCLKQAAAPTRSCCWSWDGDWHRGYPK